MDDGKWPAYALRETSLESPRFILGKSDFHPCFRGVSREVSKNKSYYKEEMIEGGWKMDEKD